MKDLTISGKCGKGFAVHHCFIFFVCVTLGLGSPGEVICEQPAVVVESHDWMVTWSLINWHAGRPQRSTPTHSPPEPQPLCQLLPLSRFGHRSWSDSALPFALFNNYSESRWLRSCNSRIQTRLDKYIIICLLVVAYLIEKVKNSTAEEHNEVSISSVLVLIEICRVSLKTKS